MMYSSPFQFFSPFFVFFFFPREENVKKKLGFV